MATNINLTEEKLEALRSEYKQRNNKQGKYPRQKMLPEYQYIYPWVMADEQDPYFAFCTVCECRLSAKRSDLGKHESSIKHTENASKRLSDGVVLKGAHQRSYGNNKETTGFDDEGEFADTLFIKQEPSVELVDPSNVNAINLEELQSSVKIENVQDPKDDKRESDANDDEEGDDDDDGDENSNSSAYEPPAAKRRVSETDSQSQHSSVLEYLPVQVTITEGVAATQQRYSLRKPQANPVHSNVIAKPPMSIAGSLPYPQIPTAPGISPGQTPCKITIKKITQPRTGNVHIATTSTCNMATGLHTMTNSLQPNKLIPSGPTPAMVPHNSSHFMSMPMSMHVQQPQGRDAFELFFDSICTSVRSLPLKLATEGKIRVMQLVGELELRAISEREQDSTTSVNSVTNNNGSSSAIMTNSQQNSTVASTTK